MSFSRLPYDVMLPKHRVELHVHFDGAVRVETLWELSQQKKMKLAGSVEELKKFCTITKPSNLANFLKPMGEYQYAFFDDPVALERIAYEFCEDSAAQGVLYSEVRYCPHLFCSNHGSSGRGEGLTPGDVVRHIAAGLRRGSSAHGIKVNSILCCVRGKPEWSREVVNLCSLFKQEGVVGLDIAGCGDRGQDVTEEDISAFELARELGIHRTAHAGEDGPAAQVEYCLDKLHAERIGHGYNTVMDSCVYERCLRDKVHFECCPYSSILTGSVSSEVKKHPITQFAEDGANFSINRDDPTNTARTLDEEYELLRSWGLNHVHFARANFNAARHSFLPQAEKDELLRQLRAVFGVDC